MFDAERYKNIKGAIPSPKDDRDWLISKSVSPLSYANISTLKEYRTSAKPEIVDQGEIGCCVACSLAYCRYIAEHTQSDNRLEFSIPFIYGNRAAADYDGEGMYPREALAQLKKYGVPHSKHLSGFYDYPTSKEKVSENLRDLLNLAYPFRISSYYRCNNAGDIKYAVHEYGAVTVMYPCFDELYYPNDKGYIAMPNNPKANVSTYHQMTIIGWTADNYWIVVNSWGTEWGDNGYCYIPFTYPFQEAWAITDNVKEIDFMNATDFKDVNKEHWAIKSLDKAVQSGILSGYEDGTLRPDENITRAEFAVILDRIGVFG